MNIKHISLLLFAGIMYITAFAQPYIKGQGVIGGNNYDQFTSMYLTTDGGFLVGGYSSSNISGNKTENSRGGLDYWVVKVDSNNTFQWDKTIGGNNYDDLLDVRQTSDGGYILGGYSASSKSGDKTKDNMGETDYWIVKLGSTGAIQWDKTIGGSNIDYCTALRQTADGGYIAGGYSASNRSGDKTQDIKGGYDYWIVKLDANGTIQWDKTIGGSSYDWLTNVEQTNDGGYIVGGYSFSSISGDKTGKSRGGYDYWIVKLDAAGEIQWDKTIGGRDYDYLNALQQTSDGGYILGGQSGSRKSGEKTQHSKGGDDYWIVKLDVAGNILWDRTIGGSGNEGLLGLQQTVDGGYILTGSSNSNISGDKTENNRGNYSVDYWVVKVNQQGKVQWDKTIGGSNDDMSYAVREIKRNDYVVGGYSRSRISGDKTVGNIGKNDEYDYWLVELKYRKPDSTAITQIPGTNKLKEWLSNTLLTYPNPARDKLTIQSSGKAIFTLTNGQGKVLLTKVIENLGTMDVSTIPAGVYYLTNAATGATQKIVVNK